MENTEGLIFWVSVSRHPGSRDRWGNTATRALVVDTVNNMPSHDREIPLLKRAAILTLHWYGEKNWAEISALLKVNPERARAICTRAKVSKSFSLIGV